MCLWDGLLGSLGALLLGSLLAGAVAVALSPLGPLGPVRPFLGVALRPDWTVIGVGVAILVLVLGGVAVLASFHSLPDRARNRSGRFTSSRVTTAATRAGLPPAVVTGVRFALEPGVGRSAVPVRSAILGAILAVTVVVATVTFGSSLDTLVSHPALYGWNWNYDIDGGGGLGDVPGPAATKLLNADPLVQSWTGIYYSTLTLDGVNVPVMGATPGAAVAPPLLSGHGLQAANQVVLGTSTLRSLHKQVGDTVQVRIHDRKPVTLRIVGTATLPPIGVVGSSHLEMGTGAVLAYRIIPPAARNLFESTPGPNAILVRTKGGNNRAALASLQSIGRRVDIAANGGSVFGVLRPAEILNYGSLGTTPLFLGAALAVGAAAALGITLVTSVRRRRHDLTILKTLGFTRGQLALAVAVQASVAAVIGCAIGIPAGIAVGRVLWNLFATEISAVPAPDGPGWDGGGDRGPRPRAGHPGGHDPGPPRGPHDDVAAPARRVAGRPSAGEAAHQQLAHLAHGLRRPGGHVEDEVLDAGRRQLLDAGHQLVRRADVRRRGLLPRDLAQEVPRRRCLLRAGGEHERAQPADRDLGRVAPDRLAVAAQDVHLVGHGGGVPDDVRHVGVARDEPQRPLLAAAADEDGRAARLHRAAARCGPRGSGSSGRRTRAPPR